MVLVVVAVLAAYLVGSIPFGVLVARARGVDIRAHGSGNIGATNAARVLGKKSGALVLLCDAAKGYLPVVAAQHWLLARPGAGPWAVAAVGAAAFVGHLAPPWLGFRGGKGVATALGVFLAIAPLATAVAAAVFVALYALFRIASVGSLAGATTFIPVLWWRGAPTAYLAFALFAWALIVVRHRGNIQRLLQRSESKV